MTPIHTAIYVALAIIYLGIFLFMTMGTVSLGGNRGRMHPYQLVAYQLLLADNFELLIFGAVGLLALSTPFLVGQLIMRFV